MKTLYDTAVADGRFTRFCAALKAGALADTVRLPGPFTLFAPTDEAFAKIPNSQVNAMLADTRRLKTLLAFHIVSGRVAAGEMPVGSLRTIEGRAASIVRDSGRLIVEGATVVEADVVASNGLLHAIDTVLKPPAVVAAA